MLPPSPSLLQTAIARGWLPACTGVVVVVHCVKWLSKGSSSYPGERTNSPTLPPASPPMLTELKLHPGTGEWVGVGGGSCRRPKGQGTLLPSYPQQSTWMWASSVAGATLSRPGDWGDWEKVTSGAAAANTFPLCALGKPPQPGLHPVLPPSPPCPTHLGSLTVSRGSLCHFATLAMRWHAWDMPSDSTGAC